MPSMHVKLFLSLLFSCSFSHFTIGFAPGRAVGYPMPSSERTPHLAQTGTGIVASEENQQLDAGIDGWLLQERIVLLSGEITPELAEGIIIRLLYLDASSPGQDIYLYINSGGGYISAGLAIYDTIRSLQSNVVTVSLGESSSMASFLLAAGAKGKRFALPHARIMVHQPLGGAEGQASDIAISAKELLYMKSVMNKLLAELTGQPLRRIETDTDRDFFLSAQDAKAYGIIDRVVDRPPSASRSSQ